MWRKWRHKPHNNVHLDCFYTSVTFKCQCIVNNFILYKMLRLVGSNTYTKYYYINTVYDYGIIIIIAHVCMHNVTLYSKPISASFTNFSELQVVKKVLNKIPVVSYVTSSFFIIIYHFYHFYHFYPFFILFIIFIIFILYPFLSFFIIYHLSFGKKKDKRNDKFFFYPLLSYSNSAVKIKMIKMINRCNRQTMLTFTIYNETALRPAIRIFLFNFLHFAAAHTLYFMLLEHCHAQKID